MTTHLYITLSGEDKLLIFAVDPATGALSQRREVAVAGGPGPLAVDPNQRTLYVGQRSTNQISAFRIQSEGGLLPLGTADLDANPCYLATDRTGRFLMAAYYGAGKVTVHALEEDGSVGAQTCSITTAEHAHFIQTDRNNRFAFVPHTCDPNVLYQFRFDVETGLLSPNDPAQIRGAAGQGPRHFAFHPTADWLYTSDENGNSITRYAFNADSGQLTPHETLSTLPADFKGKNTVAQIHMHPSGRYVYVSNRGHDSIAIFAIGEEGRLTALGQQPSEKTPRAFGLSPDGAYLYAAGQDSGNLAAYGVNDDGTLTPHQIYAVGEQPLWVMGVKLPL